MSFAGETVWDLRACHAALVRGYPGIFPESGVCDAWGELCGPQIVHDVGTNNFTLKWLVPSML
jgi:hypothetical protein